MTDRCHEPRSSVLGEMWRRSQRRCTVRSRRPARLGRPRSASHPSSPRRPPIRRTVLQASRRPPVAHPAQTRGCPSAPLHRAQPGPRPPVDAATPAQRSSGTRPAAAGLRRAGSFGRAGRGHGDGRRDGWMGRERARRPAHRTRNIRHPIRARQLRRWPRRHPTAGRGQAGRAPCGSGRRHGPGRRIRRRRPPGSCDNPRRRTLWIVARSCRRPRVLGRRAGGVCPGSSRRAGPAKPRNLHRRCRRRVPPRPRRARRATIWSRATPDRLVAGYRGRASRSVTSDLERIRGPHRPPRAGGSHASSRSASAHRRRRRPASLSSGR